MRQAQRRAVIAMLVAAVWTGAVAAGPKLRPRPPKPAPTPPAATAPAAPSPWTLAFETDPATAFEQAAKAFDALPAGQLAPRMELLRAIAPSALRLRTIGVLEALVVRTTALAEQQAAWAEQGELHLLRAQAIAALVRERDPRGGQFQPEFARIARFALLADNALAKAGQTDAVHARAADLAVKRDRAKALLGPAADRRTPQRRDQRYGALLATLLTQVAQADDEPALHTLEQLLELVKSEDRTPSPVGREPAASALGVAGRLLWLPGAARLLPRLQALAVDRRDLFRADSPCDDLAAGCALAWSGRDDEFRAGCYWALDRLAQDDLQPDEGFVMFAVKLRAFGRPAEADAVQARWLEAVRRTQRRARLAAFAGNVTELLTPATPEDERRLLLGLTCRSWALSKHQDSAFDNLLKRLAVPAGWPADRRLEWQSEAGEALLDSAARFASQAARAKAAGEAAAMLARAGRNDAALAARDRAKRYAAGDASLQLELTRIEAEELVARHDWTAAVGKLEPVAALTPTQAAALGESGATWFRAMALLVAADRGLGRHDAAETAVRTMTQAVVGLRLPPLKLIKINMELAELTADPLRKLAYLEVAKDAAERCRLAALGTSIVRKQAQLSLATKNTEVAKQALLDLIKAEEAQRGALAYDPHLRTEWFADHLQPYQQLLELCGETGDGPTALWCGEAMRGRALLDELAWRKLDLANGLPEPQRQRCEALRTQRAAVHAQLQALTTHTSGAGDSRFIFVPSRGGAPEAALDPEARRLQQQLEALDKEEAALEAAVRESVPAYRRAADVKIPASPVLKAMLPADTALLEFTLTQDGLVGVAVAPARASTVGSVTVGAGIVSVAPRQVPERAVVARKLAATPATLAQAMVDLRQLATSRNPAFDSEAEGLYSVLIAPFEPQLVGAQRLMIVADGPLALCPFAALRGTDHTYLCERLPVVLAPSLTVACAGRGEPAGFRPALVVAAPRLRLEPTGTKVASAAPSAAPSATRFVYVPVRGESVSAQLLSMANVELPGARAEGTAVAQRLPDSLLLTGTDATKARLQAEAPQRALIHIATHGFADPHSPDFSGLLLAGAGGRPYEVLTAEEVYLMNLNARLVTLSACETGLGKTVRGEGLLGLTRAFLYAGARDVTCSLWQVADSATATLMERFYGELARGAEPAAALRQAQRTLLADPQARHPFFWSGFVVMQGPR